ncbi:hypothetical protein Bca4012_067474 [Brassica carinata]
MINKFTKENDVDDYYGGGSRYQNDDSGYSNDGNGEYENGDYVRKTKNQWARDDPAFIVICSLLLIVATLAYCATSDRSVRDLDAFYEQMIDLLLQRNREDRSEDDVVDLLLRLEKEEVILGHDKLTRNHIKAILMATYEKGTDDEIAETRLWM